MGASKALLPHPAGGTMIEHAARVARSVTDEVVLLGDDPRLPDSLTALSLLPDATRDGGPLAGLCSLLRHAGDRWALLLACDLPGLTADVLKALLDHTADGVDAVAYARDRPVAPAPDERRQDVSHGIPTNRGGASANALNQQSTIDNRQSSHACCALYHARILPVAIRHLAGSRRSLQRLLADIRACTIDPDPGQTAALVNVNTPGDLDRLRMNGAP